MMSDLNTNSTRILQIFYAPIHTLVWAITLTSLTMVLFLVPFWFDLEISSYNPIQRSLIFIIAIICGLVGKYIFDVAEIHFGEDYTDKAIMGSSITAIPIALFIADFIS